MVLITNRIRRFTRKSGLSPEQISEALQQLSGHADFNEAVIVSTCNRTEVYCSLAQQNSQTLLQWLASFHGLDEHELSKTSTVMKTAQQ